MFTNRSFTFRSSLNCLRSSISPQFCSSNMSTKHLKTGDPCPALAPGKLRVYSMLLCPYAQRTRMVLIAKNIPHEVININTRAKPEWFRDKNPLTLVPTLEIDDKLIYESAICDEYLDSVYPNSGPKLLPTDPYERAKMQIMIEAVSKVSPRGRQLMLAEEDKVPELREKLFHALAPFEKAAEATNAYLAGDQLTMIDIHLWPFLERFALQSMKAKAGDILPSTRLPALSSYYKRMLREPCVKETICSEEQHFDFSQNFIQGRFPSHL